MTGVDVRWLDGDEMGAWIGLVSLCIRLPAALDAQLRRDSGISHFEYQIMAGLSQCDRRTMPMSEIAEFTKGSLSRLSHAFDRLQAQGWVTRAPDPTNGRITLATLTDAGYAKVVDTAPGHVATVRELVFDPLTKAQVGQLNEISQRVTRAVGSKAN